MVISTATTDGPGYFSGDSFVRVPTADVAPLQPIVTATQSGIACASPSVKINNPLQNRGGSLIDWGSSVPDVVKLWPGVVAGRELQLLRTAQNLQLRPLAPALLQAAQSVVTLGEQIVHLVLDSAGLIAVATIPLIIATVIQNCLVANGNAFLIPREAFSDTQSSMSGSSCPLKTLQPHCMKQVFLVTQIPQRADEDFSCGSDDGSSKCLGIKTKDNLWQSCDCIVATVYKYNPDYQQIVMAATTSSP